MEMLVRGRIFTVLGLLAACLLVGPSAWSKGLPSHAGHGPVVRGDPAALWVEPRDGERGLVRLIDRAQRLIFVEAYILTDRDIVRALERAATQSVAVYVVLEPHPLGMGNQPVRMAAQLRAAGVRVRWSSPTFALTHAKLLILDDESAVISTANWSHSGFRANREFLVLEKTRSIVLSLSAVFRADWDRLSPGSLDPRLVVAPVDARRKLTDLVTSARRTIDVYAEEMVDPEMELRLARAARRHVKVRVILPPGAALVPAPRVPGAPIAIRFMGHPYAHAKILVVDGREAFLGSENLSEQSLDRNREVGILLGGTVPRRLARVFDADWSRLASRSTASGGPL